MDPILPILLRPAEAAEYLQVSRSLIYELLQAGELESVRGARRVPGEACVRYVERLRRAARDADTALAR